jgi:3-methylfumaryl-CoA hydratase
MNAETKAAAPAGDQEWADWIGKSESTTDVISADRAAALAATLGVDKAPANGEMLPPGWHWIYFNKLVPRSEVGVDGHPKRGGFLPPVPLPRRMWAGSRITYNGGLIVGDTCEKVSVISKVQSKKGKGGELVFVTVTHTTRCRGKDAIVEEQDLVYRAPPAPDAPAAPLTPSLEGAEWREQFKPDPVLLFRYSALTYNGHRIHYDLPYARDEEGYPALVVHGPLTATLLQNFAVAHAGGRKLARFEFRGVHPVFVTAPFTLEGAKDGEAGLKVWARGPQNELSMQASVVLA